MKKRGIILTSVAALAAALAGYLTFENEALTVTPYEFSSQALPEAFDGFKICHLSDIHVKSALRKYPRLIKKVAKLSPDIIVITGDLLDSRRSDLQTALSLAETLTDIAPVYYVTGNHEESLPIEDYTGLMSSLSDMGVHLMDSRTEKIYRGENGEYINVSGIFDSPHFTVNKASEMFDENAFDLFLAHRPQFAAGYARAGADLTLSGHAHGGQMRIPFVGGLIAPDQWFFPEYSEGMHRFGDRATVISRGIGNSLIPFRINNRPEIVTATLKTAG